MSKSGDTRKGKKRGKYTLHKENSSFFKKGFTPWNKGKGKPIRGDSICSVCNKDFHWEIKPFVRKDGYITYVGTSPKTCSKECRYKSTAINQEGILRPHMQGKNSHLWRGGTTTLTNQIRGCAKYTLYRKQCFERDNYTCTNCHKKKGGNLEADHIISFAQILDFYKITTFEQALKCPLLWDLRNARTLCHNCHSKTPTYMTPLRKHPKSI
jgi:hypothetical protein